MESVDLTLPDEALGAISKKAMERKTGARGLRSIMEGILLDTMFDLPSLEGVEEVVISKQVVEGTARPLYIYADRAPDAGSCAIQLQMWAVRQRFRVWRHRCGIARLQHKHLDTCPRAGAAEGLTARIEAGMKTAITMRFLTEVAILAATGLIVWITTCGLLDPTSTC